MDSRTIRTLATTLAGVVAYWALRLTGVELPEEVIVTLLVSAFTIAGIYLRLAIKKLER